MGGISLLKSVLLIFFCFFVFSCDRKEEGDNESIRYVLMDGDPIRKDEFILNASNQGVKIVLTNCFQQQQTLLSLGQYERKEIDKDLLKDAIPTNAVERTFSSTDSCQVVFDDGHTVTCFPYDGEPNVYIPTLWEKAKDTIKRSDEEYWIVEAYRVEYTITKELYYK